MELRINVNNDSLIAKVMLFRISERIVSLIKFTGAFKLELPSIALQDKSWTNLFLIHTRPHEPGPDGCH